MSIRAIFRLATVAAIFCLVGVVEATGFSSATENTARAVTCAGGVYAVTNANNSGADSLRQAILNANCDNVNSTINFNGGLGIITLASALPDLASNGTLTLNGNGANISGNNAVRVLYLATGANVTLNNLTISSGSASNGAGIYSNGTLTLTGSTVSGNNATKRAAGIYNNGGTLTLTNSTVSGNTGNYFGSIHNNGGTVTLINSSVSGNSANDGGGIMNFYGGTLTLTNSTVSGNSANITGGGIYNGGTLTLNNSTVSGNSASNGGGIINYGTVTLTNSTVSGNSASGYGGGIDNVYGTVTLTNSTVSGNSVNYEGGGIYNGGTLTLTNSTVSGNSANYGGGIYNGGTLTLTNSIVANSGSGGDCAPSGGTAYVSHSLIGNNWICDLDTYTNNLSGDPLLGALTGSPAFHPLLTGSPAINTGSNALVSGITDQAGSQRIQGGTVDMGSFESGTTSTPVNLLYNGSFEIAGTSEKRPDGWTVTGPAPKDQRNCGAVIAGFAHDGQCVYRFKTGLPGTLTRNLIQEIVNPPYGFTGDTFTVGAWVKATGLTPGAKLLVKVVYADLTAGKIKVVIPPGTYPYTPLTTTLTLTQNITNVTVLLIGEAATTGTVLVDDVWLTLALAPSPRTVLPPPPIPGGMRGSN